METTFRFTSHNHSALFKQIPVYVGAGDAAIGREADSNELSKPTGIVISLGLRIAESLKNRVGLENLSFEEA